MFTTIILVLLLIYFAVNAAYRCYKKHWGWTIVYLVLYCVVFRLFRNDTLTLLINNRASYVIETIFWGFNSVVILLIMLYAIITLLTLPFAKGGRHQSMFLCMYLLHFIVKLSFILYNDASLLLIGIISTAELSFLNPLLGLAAYGKSKWYYHFAPYLPEFKESGSFGGGLLIASLGLSAISLIYVFVP